jgi:hypothetical protein
MKLFLSSGAAAERSPVALEGLSVFLSAASHSLIEMAE